MDVVDCRRMDNVINVVHTANKKGLGNNMRNDDVEGGKGYLILIKS